MADTDICPMPHTRKTSMRLCILPALEVFMPVHARSLFRLVLPSLVAALAVGVAGCETDLVDDGAFSGAGTVTGNDEQALTATCASTSLLKGIDVSFYEGDMDWTAAHNDGVVFAFIRVSDGLTHPDNKFARNWAQSKAAGVRRGAYQFFRENEDPIAQADLLIAAVGQLQPGDLPPVIDVESSDHQDGATIDAHVNRWLDHVEQALGVRPIVYTGPYFWRDTVGGRAAGGSPLWVAHYGTACPLVPQPWGTWAFHQYSENGHVRGIVGGVDLDVFQGSLADLDALGVGGTPPPAATPCASIGDSATIDDGDACFVAGGNAVYLHDDATGFGGHLISTGTTAAARTENFAEWRTAFDSAGAYRVEVWTDPSVATSTQAAYVIEHGDRSDSVVIDQTAVDGWQTLGTFAFQAGGNQKIRLVDNTGENSNLNRTLVFDAVRLTRVAEAPPADPCAHLIVQVGGGDLNVRSTPNTQHAPIGVVADGTVLTRLATVTGSSVGGNTTWYRMRGGNLQGYVAGAFAQCTP
jgi:lysozyme